MYEEGLGIARRMGTYRSAYVLPHRKNEDSQLANRQRTWRSSTAWELVAAEGFLLYWRECEAGFDSIKWTDTYIRGW
jgi:hypothetical protein